MKNWKYFIIFFAFAAETAAQNSRVISVNNSSIEYKVADYYLLSTHQNTKKILDSLILQYAHYDKINGYDIFLLKKLKFLDYQNLTKIPEFSLDISSSKTRTEKLIPIDHFDPSQHHIDITQQDFAQSTGKNIAVILKEHLFDTFDLDLLSKIKLLPSHSNKIDIHATTMATLIAGKGISYYTGKGIVPDAKIFSTGFQILLPERNEDIEGKNIYVCNHSYGSEADSRYSFESMMYDKQSYDLDEMQHIFSSGNQGTEKCQQAQYTGLEFCNLTGPYKHAKNIICIGAIDGNNQVYPFSSKGPTYDGRIKPELVTYGENQTSGASAVASGMFAMCQDHFINLYNVPPPAHLIKGILINTAEDIGSAGPDYTSGYGKIDLYKAMNVIQHKQFLTNSIQQFEEKELQIIVPNNSSKAYITLSWTDPAAAINAKKSLINDLDIEIKINSSNKKFLPWVLNPSPDQITNPATNGIDTLNTLEKIELPVRDYDTLTLKIKNKSNSFQKFSINYYFEKNQNFQILSPAKTNFILPDYTQDITWIWSENNNAISKIEYKYTHHNSWNLITDSISLKDESISWRSPSEFGLVQFRFILKDTIFYSDTIRICAPLEYRSALNCSDSVQIIFNEHLQALQYKLEILREGKPYLLIKSDHAKFKMGSAYRDSFLRITPIFGEFEGAPSRFIKISNVSSSCYIDLLESSYLDKENAEINIQLKEIQDLDKMILTKIDPNKNREIILTLRDNEIKNEFKINDKAKDLGNYSYQLEVFNKDLSLDLKTSNIFLVPSQYYIKSPNTSEDEIIIYSPNENAKELMIYDITGRLIKSFSFTNPVEYVELPIEVGSHLFLALFEDNKLVFRELILNLR